MTSPSEPAQVAQNPNDGIRDNILHILGIFPVISTSMLHITLGGSLPTSIWKPVLDSLVESRVVDRRDHVAKAPNGRTRHYTVLSLTPHFGKHSSS